MRWQPGTRSATMEASDKEVKTMTFGEKLYQLRKGRSMSQEALAGELGVSRQAISRWELGEVLPDTASVLAVSRLFGVSTDYLLLSDCTSEAETPAARAGEQSLRQRQEAVGKGVLSRVLWLAPAAVYHFYRLGAWEPVSIWYLLGLQVLVSALLCRQNHRYLQEGVAWRDLTVPDLAAFACVLLLPFPLGAVLNTWGVLLGQLAAVIPLIKSIKTLRLHYGLTWKSWRKDR